MLVLRAQAAAAAQTGLRGPRRCRQTRRTGSCCCPGCARTPPSTSCWPTRWRGCARCSQRRMSDGGLPGSIFVRCEAGCTVQPRLCSKSDKMQSGSCGCCFQGGRKVIRVSKSDDVFYMDQIQWVSRYEAAITRCSTSCARCFPCCKVYTMLPKATRIAVTSTSRHDHQVFRGNQWKPRNFLRQSQQVRCRPMSVLSQRHHVSVARRCESAGHVRLLWRRGL